MSVGDRLPADVPGPSGPTMREIGTWSQRVSRALGALRDHVQALVQRLEAKPYAPEDARLGMSEAWFYVDEAADKLHVRVRYSDGTLKTGEVTLT